MRKLILVSGLLPWIVVLAGCPKSTGEGADAAVEAAVAAEASAPVTPAASTAVVPNAKNAADVAHFAAETKINEPAKILASSATARTTPKAGTVVAALKAGTDVTKIAEYQDGVLVAFADPKDATSTLMGWLTKDAFTATAVVAVDAGISDAGSKDASVADAAVVDAGKPAVTGTTCPAGKEAVTGFGKDPLCKKKCTSDKDCKAGAAGSCAVAAAATGKVVRVCVNE